MLLLFRINCLGVVDQISTLYVGGQIDLPSARGPPPLAAGRRPPAWARWAHEATGPHGAPGAPWALGSKLVFFVPEVKLICRPSARPRAHGPQLNLFGADPRPSHLDP